MSDINLFISLGAGFLSFLSPCCLPLYPAFLSYITGMSVDSIKNNAVLRHKNSLLHTIFFLLGFSTIFFALAFSTSLIGTLFGEYMEFLRKAGSIIIILFGLIILEIIRPKFLMKERRISFRERPAGFFGSFLIGISFAAGWTPCSGPIIGAVLYLASTNPASSILYMSAYILGFAIPFLLLSFFIGSTPLIRRYSRSFMRIGGVFMIIMGIILYFNGLNVIIRVLSPIFGGFRGF
ncbi:cytochrome c biogenesis protein CcdA [Niallia taxi]|uniref:Cytochrome c biogenesis protein CcdA n=1 Tax=Niallia taxi TaxID=2499688 RepID=A0A437K571_9BACI|nr:cytochrome c biogenesis protein CcdA [Niallia taxi]MDK8641232.1 cytochrome c biogenesis protein CcdA [Niallia taxi]MED4038711.1 cytochrome c biogenesis protein CcdA [Niallia taxi]RVT57990.1 cytochrome c biogenesis protein CcdA [Niallia taxi]